MKKRWEVKKLGEICDFEGGSQPPKSQFIYNQKPGYVRFLQIRDFASENNVTYIPESKKNRICKESDILIGRYGASVGKILTNKAGAYNVALMKTIPNLEILDSSWFYYYLISDVFQSRLLNVADRSAQNGFSKDDIYNFPVSVPPRQEQRKIASILDKAIAGITRAKDNEITNSKNTCEIFKSYLHSIFIEIDGNAVIKTLAELCDSERIITYGVIKLGDEVFDGVPCLRTSNVRWLHINTEGMKRISPSLSSEYSRTILNGGELLVNVRGTLGGVAVVGPEMSGWNVSREVAVVPVDHSRINPVYLSYFIGSGMAQQWLGSVKKGATYIGINIEDLRLLPVPVPKIEKQAEIVAQLTAIQSKTRNLEIIYKQKAAYLDELKESILHKAFNGELSGAN